MQVDIECLTSEATSSANAERRDRIIASAQATRRADESSAGGHGREGDADRVRGHRPRPDPDVIEGQQHLQFSLSRISLAARGHGVKLALGRDRGTPTGAPAVFGRRAHHRVRSLRSVRRTRRHLLLAQPYDVTHRSLEGFGLKKWRCISAWRPRTARHRGAGDHGRVQAGSRAGHEVPARRPGRDRDLAALLSGATSSRRSAAVLLPERLRAGAAPKITR